MTAHLTKLK